ncbi:hypothetical protein CVU83_01670 [Candidatus Falkowbacteria bacterium HGW-Falkowbacteria-2]|uniref:Uncharacterized protein n=1 Tax=Candidatus Falkowbacteria bacterium HGW-Falkowbacteria-2 TaxID=2013769 RepID=A0A2N2E191_9BACT|nr:MAG: hypothetical protein CVU83_01670 [Candidatus Falkowbacteria bacterium HGW-Falkowbacteria-2]
MEISKLQNQIQAGALVRLTQEKINDLKKKDQIDGFPEREGYVKRVYNRYSPAVLDINFGNYNRYLNQNDVESAN